MDSSTIHLNGRGSMEETVPAIVQWHFVTKLFQLQLISWPTSFIDTPQFPHTYDVIISFVFIHRQ